MRPFPPRPSALVVLVLLAGLSASGCAFRTGVVGLLDTRSSSPVLETSEGRRYRLVLTEGTTPLRHLEGCQVRVEGPRLACFLFADDWRVLTASDGSEPFVGVLRLHGTGYLLEDRNSGMPVRLRILGEAADDLYRHAGKLVLVVGFVVGPQEVQVVGYRILSHRESTAP